MGVLNFPYNVLFVFFKMRLFSEKRYLFRKIYAALRIGAYGKDVHFLFIIHGLGEACPWGECYNRFEEPQALHYFLF